MIHLVTAVSRPCCCLPNYIFMLFRDSYPDACPQESIPFTNISMVLFWRVERVNSRTLHPSIWDEVFSGPRHHSSLLLHEIYIESTRKKSVLDEVFFRVHGIALHCTYMKYILTAPGIQSCVRSAPQFFFPCGTATRDGATWNTSDSRVHTKLATQRSMCTNIHETPHITRSTAVYRTAGFWPLQN